MPMSTGRAITLNHRVSSLTPSLTLAIDAKAKQLQKDGVDVVNFAAGEPDFDTAEPIKEAAIRALRESQTRYTPASGSVPLREAIAAKLKRDNGLVYKPEQIVVTVGAKHAIFNALQVVVNEGDEVLIPAPYWLSYPEMVKMAGGKPIEIPTTAATHLKLTPDLLKKALTPRSKVLILNSPSNPTGMVYSRGELKAVTEVAVDRGLVVISDEIYETLIYGSVEHHAVAALDPAFYESVITVNGLSKSFAMTGWRLGYIAAPFSIAKACTSLQSHQTSNVTSFAQAGAIEALLRGEAEAKRIQAIFSKRRDFIVERLKQVRALSFIEPEGAFYVFCDISKTGLTSLDFAARVLEEAHVALVPGKPFGADSHVRISFATSEAEIEKGIRRLADWLKARA